MKDQFLLQASSTDMPKHKLAKMNSAIISQDTVTEAIDDADRKAAADFKRRVWTTIQKVEALKKKQIALQLIKIKTQKLAIKEMAQR